MTGSAPTFYIHRPIRVAPARQAPDIPAYLYFGGVAGASAGLAALAELSGERRLARAARFAAAGCAGAAVAALVRDHRRPERFLSGLRAQDPSFPLSLGTWLTVPFAGLATITAGAEAAGWKITATITGAAAGVLGPAVCTYTAVALVDTEVPAWHEAYRELPFLFAGSGISGAAGIGLLATLTGDPAPARRLALAGAAMELVAAARLRAAPGSLGVAFRSGRASRLLTGAAALTAAGVGLALLGRERFGRPGRWAALGGGVALIASGALSRLGVYYAGQQSIDSAGDRR
ncbi:polysulfide reductase NrfD [Cryptosporangium phraense]|uniref:Polysulfide reductase n=1 Tax=Cryptosporangium phraense TaxID=2593070 RepID=A0A545ARB4_9ACTN|nr:polysulfide reductase NrfD [Cryptosporangium phraense]TQS43870.1 polysulfide reductase [Cryptosporangium phraense]